MYTFTSDCFFISWKIVKRTFSTHTTRYTLIFFRAFVELDHLASVLNVRHFVFNGDLEERETPDD